MSNKQLKLIVDKESFYLNKEGSTSVIGIIYFDLDGYFFPEHGWDDFVVALVSWLAKITIELSFDKKKEVEMDFMDGPFKISLRLNNKSQCTVSFVEGEKLAGDKEIIHKTITLPFEDFKKEVIKACSKILQIDDPEKMSFNDDYKNLENSYNLLMKVS